MSNQINWDAQYENEQEKLGFAQMTDKKLLQEYINDFREVMFRYRFCKDKAAYLFADRDYCICMARLEYLNRLTVKTPPISPQLNLFK